MCTPTSTEVVLRARPASLARRLFASFIDIAIVLGALLLLLFLATTITGKGAPTELSGLDGLVAWVHKVQGVLVPVIGLWVVLALFYSVAFAFMWNGRTPGRFLAGIHLVDLTGLPPTPTRAVVRAALSVVSAMVFLGGFWLALFDRHGQTLHDKLTRTFVVRPI
jgi:uncharacterized RDD family membrane protein YckC